MYVLTVQTHIVCHVPPYHPADAEPLKQPRDVQIIIYSNGRSSEPVPFTYHPGMPYVITLSVDHITAFSAVVYLVLSVLF